MVLLQLPMQNYQFIMGFILTKKKSVIVQVLSEQSRNNGILCLHFLLYGWVLTAMNTGQPMLKVTVGVTLFRGLSQNSHIYCSSFFNDFMP